MEKALRSRGQVCWAAVGQVILQSSCEPSFEACLGISQEDLVRCIPLGRGKNMSEILEAGEKSRVWELCGLRYCWTHAPRGGLGGEVVVVA